MLDASPGLPPNRITDVMAPDKQRGGNTTCQVKSLRYGYGTKCLTLKNRKANVLRNQYIFIFFYKRQ